MRKDDIAITGAGLATSLGVGRELSWQRVQAGEIGLGPFQQIEDPGQADRGGGEVPRSDMLPADGEPRECAFLRFAIDEALAHAGIDPAELPYAPERCGVMLGTTLHGMTAAGRMVRSGKAEPLRDFLAPAVVARATRHLQLEGFAATTCSACSSGLGSILLARTLLESGEMDLVIAGGYDPISEYAYAGFNSLRLVDERLPRPFARDRAGMKVSEGYGIVVVERADDAKQRGASAFFYLRGGGESADAHHLTQPVQDGSGAARAIRDAIHDASVQPDEIDLIVAHATGTPDNDAAEYAALSGVFSEAFAGCPIVGLKSRLGHTLGAAGAAELILAALAVRDQILPTTATTTTEDIDFQGFNLADGQSRSASLHTTVNTSLGFGGANTCVVIGDQPNKISTSSLQAQEVWVTGIGVVGPGVTSHQALIERLGASDAAVAGPVAEDDYLPLLNARRVRRLSEYVKLTLAAASLAMDDALPDESQREAFTASCPAILGTMHGSTHYSYDYYKGLVNDGLATANPMLFAEGVPNAGAAHLSMSLKLRGACQSIIGSRTAGLDALRLASLRIAGGRWDRALVCAGEEHDELVERCYAELGLPMATCGAAVTLVLESRSAAEARGARCRGVVEAGRTVNFNTRIGRSVTGLRALLDEQTRLGVAGVIDSASGTWLDRIESRGIGLAGLTSATLRGRWAECFSAGPLLAIAAAMLDRQGVGLDGGETPVAVLGSDFNGILSLARIRPVSH